MVTIGHLQDSAFGVEIRCYPREPFQQTLCSIILSFQCPSSAIVPAVPIHLCLGVFVLRQERLEIAKCESLILVGWPCKVRDTDFSEELLHWWSYIFIKPPSVCESHALHLLATLLFSLSHSKTWCRARLHICKHLLSWTNPTTGLDLVQGQGNAPRSGKDLPAADCPRMANYHQVSTAQWGFRRASSK